MSADPVDPESARRIRFAAAGLVSLLILLLAALAYQQVYRSADYSARERRQTQRLIFEPAPRGTVFDREGRALAGNRARAAAVLWPGELRGEFRREGEARSGDRAPGHIADPAAVRAAVVQRYADQVTKIVGRAAAVDRPRLEHVFARDRTQSVVLINDLTPDEAARLVARLPAGGPLRLQTTYARHYPHGRTAAHVLGRVRADVLRQPNRALIALNYRGVVGESGIEQQFESQLQGQPGEAVSYLDALGFRVEDPLEYRPPIAGADITLSLDLDLQQVMERTMRATPGSSRGAAVALAVATGEVLALASKPDFDLNAVSPVLSADDWRRVETEGGWLNRATRGLYPPGSTFKIFTTVAALRGGTLRPGDVSHCPGFHPVAGRRFPCHHAEGHGDLSLRRALAQSCNVFFYQAGLAAGADALAAEARRFHLDHPTGIELPAETSDMLVADPAWKQANHRGEWTSIDTANLAIGQGFLRYSPLQAAAAMASLARRETFTVPTLLHSPGRRPTGERPPEPLDLSDEDYAALIAGLRAVVESGIGRDAQVPGIRLAGKSGTAQILRPAGMQNIAWFVAFAPVERPAIAVAVALEGNQPNVEFAGAEHAAPVVREILGAYFDKHPPE